MRRAGHSLSTTLSGIAMLCAMLAFVVPQTAAATTTSGEATSASPLPESDYTTRSACAAPEAGHAGCLALELVPHTSAAQAHTHPLGMNRSRPIQAATAKEGAFGLRPQDLRDAYFPGKTELPDAPASEPQTIALIDAYNDPNAEADLNTYDKEFNLPALPTCSGGESGCFEQVSQNGTGDLPFPQSETVREAKEAFCLTPKAKETKTELIKKEEACDELFEAEGWSVEISTDIQTAHAICQNCKILLVEANTPSYRNLETAEETAVRLGATEISNSWGGQEEGSDSEAFNHHGIVITAAAGDDGYLNWTEAEAAEEAELKKEATGYFVGADYPASSPHVVAVGGTKLILSHGTRQSETVWNEDPDPNKENLGAGGSGCSTSLTAAPWQQNVPNWSEVGCGSKRAVADVSADGDPYTGVAVYDSVPSFHENENGEEVNTPLYWWPIGGTSVASPIVGSLFALAGGAHGVEYPAQTLYSHLGSSLFYDVTQGGNGACDDDYLSCSGSMDPLSPLDCGAGVWICNATAGYDGPSGVGAPDGIGAFRVGEAPVEEPLPEEGTTKGKSGEEKSTTKEEGSEKGKTGEEEPKSKENESLGSGKEEPAGGNGSQNKAGGGNEVQSDGASGSSSTGGGSQSNPGVTSSTTSHDRTLGAPRISALRLTQNARTALRGAALRVRQLAFSFKLSRAAIVHLELSMQSGSGAGEHWRRLSSSFAFAAIEGLNRRELHRSSRLNAGVYRLLLTPAGGKAVSILIRVR